MKPQTLVRLRSGFSLLETNCGAGPIGIVVREFRDTQCYTNEYAHKVVWSGSIPSSPLTVDSLNTMTWYSNELKKVI